MEKGEDILAVVVAAKAKGEAEGLGDERLPAMAPPTSRGAW